MGGHNINHPPNGRLITGLTVLYDMHLYSHKPYIPYVIGGYIPHVIFQICTVYIYMYIYMYIYISVYIYIYIFPNDIPKGLLPLGIAPSDVASSPPCRAVS
jgi:hypothetical protein